MARQISEPLPYGLFARLEKALFVGLASLACCERHHGRMNFDIEAAVKDAALFGFAIGIIETFGAAYISVPFKDAFAFLVLILFLIVRPQGIFGERVAEKA